MNDRLTVWLSELAGQSSLACLLVIDLVLKATALLLAGLLLDAVLRRRWPVACATMWNALLAALVVLPLWEGVLPKTNFLQRFLPTRTAAVHEAAVSLPTAIADPVSPSIVGPSIVPAPYATPLSPPSVSPVVAAELPAEAPATVARTAEADKVAEADRAADTPAAVAPQSVNYPFLAVSGVYALGLLVALSRFGRALWSVRRLRRSSRLAAEDDWQQRFVHWVGRFELSQRIELRTSDAVNVPLVVGARRPLVVVPCDVVEQATPQSRDAILVHELTHVARGDYAWQLLLRLVQAALWFHPLVWLVERRINYARERVCDAFSVHRLGSVEQYADALLEMAGRLARRCSLSLGLAVVRSSKLGERLAAIYDRGGIARYTASRRGRTFTAAAALSLSALLAHAAVAQVFAPRLPGLPAAANAIVATYESEAGGIVRQAQEQLRLKRQQTIGRLQALQDEYTRSAKLDEAVAIRDQIRQLQALSVAGAKSPAATASPINRKFHTDPNSAALPSDLVSVPAGLPSDLVSVPAGPVMDPATLNSTVELVPNLSTTTTALAWSPNLLTPGWDANLRLGEFRGQNGGSLLVLLTGDVKGPLWGNDVYTDDSLLAKAAVHAGVLKPGETGTVKVTILPGQSSYQGSTRNGVTSSDYGSYGGSFRIERAEAPVGDVDIVQQDPNEAGNVRYLICRGSINGVVYGTNVYTDDSPIATAAVHAGILKSGEIGTVKVTILPGQTEYRGTTHNGVTSQGYGIWDASFRVEADDRHAAGGKAPDGAAFDPESIPPFDLKRTYAALEWLNKSMADEGMLSGSRRAAAESLLQRLTALLGEYEHFAEAYRPGTPTLVRLESKITVLVTEILALRAKPEPSKVERRTYPRGADVTPPIDFQHPQIALEWFRKFMATEGMLSDSRRPTAESLLQRLTILLDEYAQLSEVYGPSHPKLADLESKIGSVATQISDLRPRPEPSRVAPPAGSGSKAESSERPQPEVHPQIDFTHPETVIRQIQRFMDASFHQGDSKREGAEKLLEQVAELLLEYERLMFAYGNQHPKALELQKLITRLTSQIIELSGVSTQDIGPPHFDPGPDGNQ